MDNDVFVPNPESVSIFQIKLMANLGALAIILTDASSQQFPCCFPDTFSTYPGRLYIGADHPSDPKAVMPELGSDIQNLVISALKEYLDLRYTQIEQDFLATRDYQNADLHTCWKSSWTVTEQEYVDWLLLQCVNWLQTQTEWAKAS